MVTIPLSAGNDSRAVLAAARPLVEGDSTEVRVFTSVGADFDTRIDVQGAAALAKIARLPHEVRQRQRHAAVPARDMMRNFARIGEAKAGPVLSNPRLLQKEPDESDPDAGTFILAGMGGGQARGTFYGHKEKLPEITASQLLRRMPVVETERTLAAAQAWLDNVPDFIVQDRYDTLDLAAFELRLGCWEANSRYLWPGRPKVLSFMTSGFCIEQVFTTPVAYRQAGRMQRDMIAHGWPELLAVPINRAQGVLHWEHQARKLLRPLKRGLKALLRR